MILNADDFGLTEGVCAGIVRAIHAGGLTSTTAMACAPGSLERVGRWAPQIPGRIGAHLQLTGGKPLLPAEQVPSLVDENGIFPASRKGLRAPRQSEILAEWLAQIETLRRIGIHPTHLDSHHHVHSLPEAFEVICEVAARCGVAARPAEPEMAREFRARGVACVDRALTGWYQGELTVATLMELLVEETRDLSSAAIVEVMCHPGLVDDDLWAVSKYVEYRETELATLCDVRLQQALATAGFEISSYSVLIGTGL